MRNLLIIAALASLSACGGGDTDRESRRDRDSSRAERDNKSGSRDRDRRAEDEPREADPALVDELAAEARAGRRSLPRDVGEGVMLEDIEANDAELVFFFRTPFPLDESRIGQMRTAERANMCEQAQTRDWFSRGATLAYRITDSSDEEFRFSYNNCPAART